MRIALGIMAGLLAIIVLACAYFWTPDRTYAELKVRWGAPPSRFVAIDGMQVHYRDEGPAADPEPVVLLHGTGSSLHTWQGWVDRLSPTHRMIRLDRPGFGLTGPNPTGDYSTPYYSAFLLKFLNAMHVDRAILVGNSSGGRMAWHFAATHPERVVRLVLIDASGYPRTTPFPFGLRMSMSPVFGPVLAHILPKAAVRKGLEQTYGNSLRLTNGTVDQTFNLSLRPGNRKALGATLRQGLRDYSPLIATIKVPTLIIWGGSDTVVPSTDARRYLTDIRGSTLTMLPGVGHVPQEEVPTQSAAAMTAFLAQHANG